MTLRLRSGRALRARLALLTLAALSMAHVGSPDTFFGGKAGPYDVRVSVRLPGVIPGRAQVTVRVEGVTTTGSHRVAVRAGQWNVGLKGAPPPEIAAPVPGEAAAGPPLPRSTSTPLVIVLPPEASAVPVGEHSNVRTSERSNVLTCRRGRTAR